MVNDVVNLVWDMRRFRRLMRNVLNGDNENVLTPEFTLRLRMETAERINRMAAGAEARRNAAWREIDRHRANSSRGSPAVGGGRGPGRGIQGNPAQFDRRRGGA